MAANMFSLSKKRKNKITNDIRINLTSEILRGNN